MFVHLCFIPRADQIERNRLAGEQGGVDLWEAVEKRFAKLKAGASH